MNDASPPHGPSPEDAAPSPASAGPERPRAAPVERVPLRPGHEGKAERGFALLAGEPPEPSKARPLALRPDATLDELLAAAFGEGLRQLSANVAPAARGTDPEGVHQLRVGVRRLRSLFSLFRELLPREQGEPLGKALRRPGRILGPARDLDVLLAEALEPLARRRPEDAGLRRLRETALAARDAAQEAVRAALEAPDFARLELELGHFVTGRLWRAQPLSPASARLFAPAAQVGGELLARRWKKVRRRARVLGAGRDAPAEALHALRIECKKLRYASEFFAPLFHGKAARRFARRLARLQDHLGQLNDAATAERLGGELLERLGEQAGAAEQRAAGFLAGHAAGAAEARLDLLAEDWRRLAKQGPFWT